ncbi:unnamed protein product [Symbiodinium pilosum]|uniref:Uncharacterized protein n=1 Tax=Symbiodinium pilosum TaxID=2952 RepID=A0A812INZ8_SYMPI|nr:unnamed protein product [Symbiodinium pilosum]
MAEGFGKGQLIGQCKQPRVWQIDHKSWRLFALFCTDELVRPVNAVDLKSPRSKSPSSRREENRCKRRQLKKDEPLSKRGQTQRPSVSLVGLTGNLTIEALQFLLQQPRNRLLIEESHELQAGTEMGKYMAMRGSEQTLFQLPASRAPVGFLRHNSWARAVASVTFHAWVNHLRRLRQEGIGRRRRRSSSVLIVKDLASSLHPQGLGERIDSDSSDSGDGEEEPGESIFDPLVVDAAALHTAFRTGSLMAILKAKQSSHREAHPDAKEKNVLPELSPSNSKTESGTGTERKGSKRRHAKPSKETSGNSAWDEEFGSPDERMRRERLMNDAEYVGFQMDKLRRTKVVNRLAQTSAPDLFEAGTGTSIQKSGPRRLGKDGESISLPNLARGKADPSKTVGKRGSSTFFLDKDEKKRGLPTIPGQVFF